MQPFLFISSDIEGLIYINGRLVGVTRGDALCVPVSPTGAVHVEHRPLKRGFLPFAGTVALSRGNVVRASVPLDRGLSVISWPGGATQLEIDPEPVSGYVHTDENEVIHSDGTTRRTITPLNDTVGHVIVETSRNTDGNWEVIQSEIMWAESCPKWPENAEDTAIAAAQAAILGLEGEAGGYVAVNKPQTLKNLIGIYSEYDGCVKAQFCASGDAVALVKVITPNLASVDYARYSCARPGGRQGEWLLEKFNVERRDG